MFKVGSYKTIRSRYIIILLLAILIFFVNFSWNISVENKKNSFTELAKGYLINLDVDRFIDIDIFNTSEDDDEYLYLKSLLMNINSNSTDVEFVYFLKKIDNQLYFIADSVPVRDIDSSPIGSNYYEASQEYFVPFQTSKSYVTTPVTDRWGKWVSVLIPIFDEDKNVIALFALDIPFQSWRDSVLMDTFKRSFVVVILFLVSIFVINFINNQNKVMLLNDKIQREQIQKNLLYSSFPGLVYKCLMDENWTAIYLSEGCKELTGYEIDEVLENNKVSMNDMISVQYREQLRNRWDEIIVNNGKFSDEYTIVTADGKIKWVQEVGMVVYDNDENPKFIEGFIYDVDARKNKELEIEYLSYHDYLTGLYNRRFLSEEIKRWDTPRQYPISLIIGDINGLKFINDAFGYSIGDELIVKTANVLNDSCRSEDIIARLGGDEFCVLLPKTDSIKVQEIINRINNNCDKLLLGANNSIEYPGISLGYITKDNETQDMDVLMLRAEESMKKNKLINKGTTQGGLIQSIMKTLYTKSQETEEHSQRLLKYSIEIAEILELDRDQINELSLLSRLHDIGKVAIDAAILNKTGKLTDEEWDELKMHSEYGYKIAMASPELAHIANYILHHHERWDGEGYPKRLKGDEIPLLSRILAVLDAFDAMTEDRIYRKAMTNKQAIDELVRCSGTQFDPEITKVFVEYQTKNYS